MLCSLLLLLYVKNVIVDDSLLFKKCNWSVCALLLQAIVKLAENFNGADLRNICTEAGMFAIRDERDYVVHEDFMKAARKLNDAKKLESSATYDSSFGDGGKT